jgi:signal transduction histidine kinase
MPTHPSAYVFTADKNRFYAGECRRDHSGFLVSGDVKDKVEVLFKDTWSGISQEALKNIYDPFYTTKEVDKDTGLGLSISYGIIQDHKGVLDVLKPARREQRSE